MRDVHEAIVQYGMIGRDTRWLVCLSGGKDSYTLLSVLYELKSRGMLAVDLLAYNLTSGSARFSLDRSTYIFEPDAGAPSCRRSSRLVDRDR